MAELKPCPFCGGKAKIWHESSRDKHICFDTISVFCLDCGARTREIWTDEENKYRAERDAIEAWNRRTELPELRREDGGGRRMRLTHYDEHKKRWQINDDYGAVMIDELNYAVGEAIDKLAAYENAEEQGLLVRLPCKVGDTIYVIFNGKIWDGEVYHISYSDYYGKITATAYVKQGISAGFEYFGKTVFLTRKEAEAALKGEREDD